ncbi:MAG: hypothetical protein AAGA60_15355 [Cyanobacteria bacterium P01_E01_bin.42]
MLASLSRLVINASYWLICIGLIGRGETIALRGEIRILMKLFETILIIVPFE